MAEAPSPRAALARARRIVVKVGSKSLARDGGSGESVWLRLARDLHAVAVGGGGRRSERQVVLVSSGAIALGMDRLGMKRRPKDMAALQAAAATGQGLLMQRWSEAFGALGLPVAQVLLTHGDLASRTRANNAKGALDELLGLGVVPIINENDAVAVDEIKFGDNDELASMVTPLCGADLLVLLSDVEGLLDEAGVRVPLVRDVGREARHLATDATSGLGRGGMHSKLEAVRRATLAGAHAVIASAAEPAVLPRLLAGEDLGTLFCARERRISSRKHWIAFTLRPRGAALLDVGAADAIVHSGRSVLTVGVVGVRGNFVGGDAIGLYTLDGVEIGRGLARLSAADAARLAGGHGAALPADRASAQPHAAGADRGEVLVHRDDLVLFDEA
ncbi:MAG: glutamate 5-kinase [Myxococcales bacterium]|nr:glutamate 5-kinase [Myxococcales bacterium]